MKLTKKIKINFLNIDTFYVAFKLFCTKKIMFKN